MSVYHNILSSRSHSYLICRNNIFYFSMRVGKSLVRKSLFTDSLKTAQQIVANILSNPISHSCTVAILKSLIQDQIAAATQWHRSTPRPVQLPPTQSTPVRSNTTYEPQTLTFSQAVDAWEEDKSSNLHYKSGGVKVLDKTKKEKTTYLRYVFGHLWKHKPITQISSADIDYALYVYSRCPKKSLLPWTNLTDEQQISAGLKGEVPLDERFGHSLNRVKTALKGFFDHYWRRSIIATNPMTELRFCFQKTYNNRGLFTQTQIRKLVRFCIDSPTSSFTCAIALQLLAGLRNKEIESITSKDIKTFRAVRYLHVRGTKTVNAERYVPIHPLLEKLGVIDYIRGDKPMLSSPQISYRFKELMIKLRFEPEDQQGNWLSFYSLRHNFATALAQSGASEIHIEWLLGHTHTGTKSKYIANDVRHVPKLAKTINKISLV